MTADVAGGIVAIRKTPYRASWAGGVEVRFGDSRRYCHEQIGCRHQGKLAGSRLVRINLPSMSELAEILHCLRTRKMPNIDITALINELWLGVERGLGSTGPSVRLDLVISSKTRFPEVVSAASERSKYVIETKGTGPFISLVGAPKWARIGRD